MAKTYESLMKGAEEVAKKGQKILKDLPLNIPEKTKKKKPRKTLLDTFMEGPGADTFRRGAEAVRKLDEPIETGSDGVTSDGLTLKYS